MRKALTILFILLITFSIAYGGTPHGRSPKERPMSDIFPVIESTSDGAVATPANSWTIDYPSSPAAGELLLMLAGWRVGIAVVTTITPPAGWEVVSDLFVGATPDINHLTVLRRVADGTEGGAGTFDITFTSSADAAGGWRVFRISGASVDFVMDKVNTITLFNNLPDPPFLDPGFRLPSNAGILWIAAASIPGTTTIASYPTGYTHTDSEDGTIAGVGGMLMSAAGTFEGHTTEDPPFFELKDEFWWVATTIAIRGSNFPQVQDSDTKTGTQGSDSTSWTLTYPTNIKNDDLLIAFLAIDGGVQNATFPAGWSNINRHNNGATVHYQVWKKHAVGTETGNFTVTLATTAEQGTWEILRINGGSFEVTPGALGSVPVDYTPQLALGAAGSSANPNPTALNSTWNKSDILWFAFGCCDAAGTVSSYPSNYANGSNLVGGASGASLFLARRELTATSDDPGTYTMTGSVVYAAGTLGISPKITTIEALPAWTLRLRGKPLGFNFTGTTMNLDAFHLRLRLMDAEIITPYDLASIAINSFIDRMRRPDREVILVTEIEIAKEISKLPPRNTDSTAWSSAPTINGTNYPNVEYIAISDTINGTPLDITRFEARGVEYTYRPNVADVNAHAKSWTFFAGTLYVRAQKADTGYLNKSICNAYFKLYFGEKPNLTLNGRHYLPWLLATSELFTVRQEMTDQWLSFASSDGGRVTLNNAGTDIVSLDTLLKTYEWPGGRVITKAGVNLPESDMPYSQYVIVASGKITDDIEWSEEAIVLPFGSPYDRLDVPFLQLDFDTESTDGDRENQAGYTNLPQENEGLNQAVHIGANDDAGSPDDLWASAWKGTIVDRGNLKDPHDTTQGWIDSKFKLAGQTYDPESDNSHGIASISKVIKKPAVGEAETIPASDYILSDRNTTITMRNGRALGTDDQIGAVGQALEDRAGKFTGETTNAHVKYPQDLMQKAFNHARYKTSEIDIASFTVEGVTKTIDGSAYIGTMEAPAWYERIRAHITKQMSCRDVIAQCARSLRACVRTGLLGTIELKIISDLPDEDGIALTSSQIDNLKCTYGTKDRTSRVVVEFKQKPDGTYRRKRNAIKVTSGATTDIIDTPAESLPSGIMNDLVYTTWLTSRAKVRLLAARLYNWYKRGVVTYQFKDISGLTLASLVGDTIVISAPRAIGGELVNKPVIIKSIVKNFADLTTEITAIEVASTA